MLFDVGCRYELPTVPTIPEAIIERAKHPAYGYFSTRKEYLDSVIKWHETRNDVTGRHRSALAMKMVFWWCDHCIKCILLKGR